MAGDELTALMDLDAGEVSLVTRGANRKKRFPVFKTEDGMNDDMQEILKAVLETEVDDESKITEIFKQGLSDKGMSAVRGALRLLSAFSDELPKDVMSRLSALLGEETAAAKQKAGDSGDDDDKSQVSGQRDKMEKSARGSDSRGAGTGDGDLTHLPDNIRKQVEAVFKSQGEQVQKAMERAQEAERILKTERDERQKQEFIAKAKEELSHFPGASAEELGLMLKGLHDVDPQLAQQQMKRMREASEALRQSALLSEVGKSSPDEAEGSVWDRVQKMASNIVQKSDTVLSHEKAVARILKTNPKLYQEYLQEHPAQVQPGM